MKLTARRQLTGDWGTVTTGQQFEAIDDHARELLAAGLADRVQPLQVQYETKIVVPEASEVSPRLPFRDVSLPDAQPAPLAPESDRVLADSNLRSQRAADSGGRRRRAGSGASA